MLRLFLAVPLEPAGTARLAGDDLHHLRVRRLGPGARLRLVDERGREFDALVEHVGPREAVVRVVETIAVERESSLELVLAAALLKGPKMDLLVEKATELGVTRIAPVETRHGVARGAHAERWSRIAMAAAKQSGRTRIPAVDPPAPLAAVLAAPWDGLRILAWERETARRFAGLPERATAVVALVGPEGGFADDEAAAACERGFIPVSLGPRILRAETAAIVVVASCQARWGDG